MKRIIASIAGGVLLSIAGAGAANATEPVTPDPYIVAVWEFDSSLPVGSGDQAPYPQHLFQARTTADKNIKHIPVPSTCGKGYQVDLYANDAATVRLVVDVRVLNGWRTDAESWPGGEYRSEFSRVIFNPACPPMPAGYDVPTVVGGDLECGDGWYEDIVRIDTYAHKLVDNQWVPYIASTREERQNNRPVTEEECPPIVVPPVDPPIVVPPEPEPPVEEPTPLPEVVPDPVVEPAPVATPVTPVVEAEPLSALPETGPAEDIGWGMFWLAVLTVAAGLSFWLAGSTKSDRYHKRDVK